MPESPDLKKNHQTATVVPGSRLSKLALLGFVLTLIPVTYIPVLGFFLGILAWVRITWQPQRLHGKGWAIAAAIIGFLWWFYLISSVYLSSAFNRIIMPADRAKQLEAQSSMRSLWEAEAMHVHQKLSFSDDPAAMGWQPAGNWLYTYYLGKTVLPPKTGPSCGLPANVTTYVTADTFFIAAAANLDQDADVDVWTMDQTGDTQHVFDDLKKTAVITGR